MNRVENLEPRVQSLNAEELRSFREWFARFDSDAWDAQIEAPAKSGKLQTLAGRVVRDHKSGRSAVL
jgi:hypothetical protein